MVIGVFLSVTLLIDFFELLRRASDKPEVSIVQVFELAILKLPDMAQRISPYAVLIAGILTLTRLSKSQELVIARSAGISAWQFMLPPVTTVFLIGVVILGIFNPVASAMLSRFEVLEGRLLKGNSSMLAVSSSGLWLRQTDVKQNPPTETIIHAQRISQEDMRLEAAIIFTFDGNGKLLRRIDAKSASLDDDKGDERWEVENAMVTEPGKLTERRPLMFIPTDLTMHHLQDSFVPPETLSFWQLTSFISTLEKAGFSALQHRLHWNWLASLPFMFAAMMLVAALFALRVRRGVRAGRTITIGIFCGFFIYFASDLIHALGLSGTLPVTLAAWIPPLVTLLAGSALMLHFEDG
jgi:lipopolysaccharide export system permease protein